MTSFRISIGPVSSPMGAIWQAVDVDESGQLLFAPGGTLNEAMRALDNDPRTQDDWIGPARLIEQDVGGALGTPNAAQFGAVLEHLNPLIDPDKNLVFQDYATVRAMMTALAARWFLGGGLAAGTSRPFQFVCEGAVTASGHVILNAGQDGLTCIAMSTQEDVRAFYEAGLSDDPKAARAINHIGVSISSGPEWAMDVYEDLTGQRFVPQVFAYMNGEPEHIGSGRTQLLALLMGGWPQNPMEETTHNQSYDLPVGTGTIAFIPVRP